MKDLSCAILCGGKSSRMGSNKALLEFYGRPLVQYMYEKMQTIFSSVYLVAKDNTPFEGFSHQFIQEQGSIYAPLIGIEAILQNIESGFIISVDTPFIGREEIEKLAMRSQTAQIVYAKTPQKSHFLCGIYHNSILPIVRDMIEKKDFKISNLISQTKSDYVEFLDESLFDNLNTPQDYQKALGRIKHYG